MNESSEKTVSFFEALKDRDIKKVEEFIKNDPELLKSTNTFKQNPLIFACWNNGNNKLSHRVDRPIDYDDSVIISKLIESAKAYFPNQKEFLEWINFQDCDRCTALMEACSAHNLQIVKILIENNANLDLKDARKRTALIRCASRPFFADMIELLLEHHADPSVENYSALHDAEIAQSLEYHNPELQKHYTYYIKILKDAVKNDPQFEKYSSFPGKQVIQKNKNAEKTEYLKSYQPTNNQNSSVDNIFSSPLRAYGFLKNIFSNLKNIFSKVYLLISNLFSYQPFSPDSSQRDSLQILTDSTDSNDPSSGDIYLKIDTNPENQRLPSDEEKRESPRMICI